jgi:hypothetical protein
MRKGFLIYEEMRKYFSPYMRRPLVIYDFATAPLWISLYMRKTWFSFLLVFPGPVVIKKDDEPLCPVWQSPLSKYRWFSVYSMNKTEGWRKMFTTRANVASWSSSCSAPSQHVLHPLPCFGTKTVYNYGLWACNPPPPPAHTENPGPWWSTSKMRSIQLGSLYNF